jgi:cytochrome c biogenesis protein CcmG/thiol:disulfide interchange protein DsbE
MRRTHAMRPAVLAIALVAGASCTSDPVAPPASPPAAAGFPDDWFWDLGGSRARHRPMVGELPPPLSLTGWVGVPVTLEELRRERKVVVVDFWATWCGPCVQSLPKMAALATAHPEDLVVLGVHDAKRGADRMAEVAGRAGALYPLAIDHGGQSEKAWQVSFWPTIAVIDREGRLRAIGLKPEHVADAVERVLAE